MKALLFVMLCSGVAAADTKLGVMADAGVPDGAMASLVYRPINAVRVHGGIGYNAVSRGMRAGVTLAPLKSWFSPTVSIDYGRYREGDANPLARRIMGDPDYSSEALEHVGYDFGNAHVGIVLGRERASFYLQGGMSRTHGRLYDDTTTAKVTMYSPSARIGFVLYLY
ncbi:MAG TPA: hypothetical protein VK427_25070 [Kofleriaceae bacterium]|nr:hypothetical protein [Kofleriaceae bacterium]